MYNRKHAYLIMAHGDWSVLSKLLMILDNKRNDFYVHIDKKSNVDLKEIYHPQKSNINYIKRTNVSWGGVTVK